jgi:hypothetical protein
MKSKQTDLSPIAFAAHWHINVIVCTLNLLFQDKLWNLNVGDSANRPVTPASKETRYRA